MFSRVQHICSTYVYLYISHQFYIIYDAERNFIHLPQLHEAMLLPGIEFYGKVMNIYITLLYFTLPLERYKTFIYTFFESFEGFSVFIFLFFFYVSATKWNVKMLRAFTLNNQVISI